MALLDVVIRRLVAVVFGVALLLLQACSPEAGESLSDSDQRAAAAELSDKKYQEVATQLVQQRLLPDFEEHAERAASLRSLVTESCNVSSVVSGSVSGEFSGEARQIELEKAWAEAYLSWQKINFLLFGPLNEEGALRLQFYPDPRQLVPSRVKKLLLQPESITPEAIASGIAPAQGYPALEQLIFAIPANTPNRCQFMKSASAFIADRSAQLHHQWQNQAAAFSENGKEAIGRTVDSLQRSINRIYDRRLAEPLGLRGPMKEGKPLTSAPKTAEAGLAKQSLPAILVTLQSTRKWITGELGLQQLAVTESQKSYFSSVDSHFVNVISALEAEKTPLVKAVGSQPQSLLAIRNGSLAMLKTELAKLNSVLDVYTGFNADDGD